MSTLVAIAYPDTGTAEQVRAELVQATKEHLVQLEDVVVVEHRTDGEIKVLYVVPITPLERHLLVDHGRESFIEYVSGNGIDLLSDRWAPREWYNPNEAYRGPDA